MKNTFLLLAGLFAFLILLVSIEVSAQNDKIKHWPRDYRHIHKAKAKLATQGKWDQVPNQCQAMLKDYPQDGESLFFLALAEAQTGNLDKALGTIDRAEKYGLPLGRFLAGPRSWNARILKGEAFAPLRTKAGPLIHGPMLGCISSNSAKFWVRTLQPEKVRVGLTGPNGDSKTFEGTTTGAKDFTGIIFADGLEPNTEYSYEVQIDGKVLGKANSAFKTAPKEGSPVRLQIGFGGGAAYTPKYERMWKTILKRNPQLFFFLGDNVYIDSPTFPEYQRYLYYRRQSQPDYRKLCATAGIYAIWDDHDFGTNDCAGGPDIHNPKWKVPVWNVFRRNWNNPAYGGGEKQPGCWFDFVHGDIHFIFLDGRFYRSKRRKNSKEAPTMLGKAQLEWLLRTLKNSKGKIIVILSPVPWVGGNPDKWNGFPEEREQIFSFIEKNKIEGVMLMSADRHRSDVLVTRRKKGYDLYEFMSSRLTNVHTHGRAGPKDGALFSYNKKCSFGLVTFDTTKDDPEVLYQIINIDNDEIHQFRLRRSQMTFATKKE